MEKETKDKIEIEVMIGYYTKGYDMNFINHMINEVGFDNRKFTFEDTETTIATSKEFRKITMKKLSKEDILQITTSPQKTTYVRYTDGDTFTLTIEPQEGNSYRISSIVMEKGNRLEKKN